MIDVTLSEFENFVFLYLHIIAKQQALPQQKETI